MKVNPNRFRKLPPANEGKYLDYSINVDNRVYEIETKGTVSNYYTSMKNDILNKKKNNAANKNVYLKFGTIAMILNSDANSNKTSRCVVVDDPPIDVYSFDNNNFQIQILYYSLLLSYIIDTKYYNRFIKAVFQNKINKAKIDSSKFFGKYIFYGKTYLGEYFDYRLNKDNNEKYFNQLSKKSEVFKIITREIGKTKNIYWIRR